MINPAYKNLSIVRQCELLSISRSGFYYEHCGVSKRNLEIMKSIDRIHTEYPFYGFRKPPTNSPYYPKIYWNLLDHRWNFAINYQCLF